jgi:hypothetical protein
VVVETVVVVGTVMVPAATSVVLAAAAAPAAVMTAAVVVPGLMSPAAVVVAGFVAVTAVVVPGLMARRVVGSVIGLGDAGATERQCCGGGRGGGESECGRLHLSSSCRVGSVRSLT